jgi:hypothetical protein
MSNACAVCGVTLTSPGLPWNPRETCSAKCRKRRSRSEHAARSQRGPVLRHVDDKPVMTVQAGNNADLIAEVCRLYAPPGSVICDVTYATGRFWRKTDVSQFKFAASDLEPKTAGVLAADCRALPYQDGSADIVVLDLPYIHSPGNREGDGYAATTHRYNSRATIGGFYHADIMELYQAGMAEAFRVLRPDGGQLWVKSKDQVQREIQCWSHIELYKAGRQLGFTMRDLFVLVPSAQPAERWPGRVQHHARKNHSFLLLMERPDERYAKLLGRAG